MHLSVPPLLVPLNYVFAPKSALSREGDREVRARETGEEREGEGEKGGKLPGGLINDWQGERSEAEYY